MLIKLKFDGSRTLFEIARFCGCAPCQILIVNNVVKETDIKPGQEIFVPVVLKCLIVK